MIHQLDWDKINDLVEQRYLSVQKHPEADLYICNYTAKAQYDAFWNDYTLICRGLIIDKAGCVVARPFVKFFNLGEIKPDDLPQEPFDVYEKLDGSLGIMYWTDSKSTGTATPRIATRGSFVSDQAQAANKILSDKYTHIIDKLDPALTYLFEIVYPGNRVVVDYEGVHDLFLLAIVDTNTGRELPLIDIGFPLAAKHDGIQHLTQLQQYAQDNREGFVIRFASGMRVKVKFEEYVRLHRIITGLSVLELWEYLSEGKSLDDLLEKVPDEVYNWVQQSIEALQSQYNAIEQVCKKVYQKLPTRKETALYFQKQKYPHILFAMLTGKDHAPLIWKMIRPDGGQKYFKQLLKDDSSS